MPFVVIALGVLLVILLSQLIVLVKTFNRISDVAQADSKALEYTQQMSQSFSETLEMLSSVVTNLKDLVSKIATPVRSSRNSHQEDSNV